MFTLTVSSVHIRVSSPALVVRVYCRTKLRNFLNVMFISVYSSPLELIFKVFSDGLPVGMQNQFSSSPPKEKKRRGKQQINIWE